ncbi:hypothetical protein CP8484711_0511, partial [Chlamydia psittaci 84-8471/1]
MTNSADKAAASGEVGDKLEGAPSAMTAPAISYI